jgi:hypothetical protein
MTIRKSWHRAYHPQTVSSHAQFALSSFHRVAHPRRPFIAAAAAATTFPSLSPMVKLMSDRQKHRNALARARMARMRLILLKDPSQRSAEEQGIVQRAEDNRRRKNERARQRLQESQERIDRILAIPEEQRSNADKAFLEKSMSTRERKITCDRERRKTLYLTGTSTIRDAALKGIPVPKFEIPNPPKIEDLDQRAAEYLAKVSSIRKENRTEKDSSRGDLSSTNDCRIGVPDSHASRPQPPPQVSFGAAHAFRFPLPFARSFGSFVPSGPSAWAALSYPFQQTSMPPPSSHMALGVEEDPGTDGQVESV